MQHVSHATSVCTRNNMSLRALKRTKHGTLVDADKRASGARSTSGHAAQDAQQVIQTQPPSRPTLGPCIPSVQDRLLSTRLARVPAAA